MMQSLLANIGGEVGKIYRLPLIAVLWIVIGVIVFWLICSNVRNPKFTLIWKYINMGILVLSVFGIVLFTIVSRGHSNREIMLIPFYSLVMARENNEIYRTLVMNMLLFFPFGLSFPFAMPRGVKHKVALGVVIAAIGSTLIEVVQYCFYLGRCETDDVIMNTLGAMIGAMVYLMGVQRKDGNS